MEQNTMASHRIGDVLGHFNFDSVTKNRDLLSQESYPEIVKIVEDQGIYSNSRVSRELHVPIQMLDEISTAIGTCPFLSYVVTHWGVSVKTLYRACQTLHIDYVRAQVKELKNRGINNKGAYLVKCWWNAGVPIKWQGRYKKAPNASMEAS